MPLSNTSLNSPSTQSLSHQCILGNECDVTDDYPERVLIIKGENIHEGCLKSWIGSCLTETNTLNDLRTPRRQHLNWAEVVEAVTNDAENEDIDSEENITSARTVDVNDLARISPFIRIALPLNSGRALEDLPARERMEFLMISGRSLDGNSDLLIYDRENGDGTVTKQTLTKLKCFQRALAIALRDGYLDQVQSISKYLIAMPHSDQARHIINGFEILPSVISEWSRGHNLPIRTQPNEYNPPSEELRELIAANEAADRAMRDPSVHSLGQHENTMTDCVQRYVEQRFNYVISRYEPGPLLEDGQIYQEVVQAVQNSLRESNAFQELDRGPQLRALRDLSGATAEMYADTRAVNLPVARDITTPKDTLTKVWRYIQSEAHDENTRNNLIDALRARISDLITRRIVCQIGRAQALMQVPQAVDPVDLEAEDEFRKVENDNGIEVEHNSLHQLLINEIDKRLTLEASSIRESLENNSDSSVLNSVFRSVVLNSIIQMNCAWTDAPINRAQVEQVFNENSWPTDLNMIDLLDWNNVERTGTIHS